MTRDAQPKPRTAQATHSMNFSQLSQLLLTCFAFVGAALVSGAEWLDYARSLSTYQPVFEYIGEKQRKRHHYTPNIAPSVELARMVGPHQCHVIIAQAVRISRARKQFA